MKSCSCVLVLSVIFSAICKSNAIGIPDNSPLYSKPFVHGPNDVESGKSINIFCNLTQDNAELEIPKYTFVEMQQQNCRQYKNFNLSHYVTYLSEGLLLRYPVPKTFQGSKTFACVLKSQKDALPPACHTVFIGSQPGKPKVSCVVHGFQRLRCTITPSGVKVKEATGLVLPRHNFSQSYQVLLNGKKIICEHEDRISKASDSKQRCKYTEDGILTYNFPSDMIDSFVIRILYGNIFGYTEVKQTFNTCEIEQPVIGILKTLNVTTTSARLNWTIKATILPTERDYYENSIQCSSQSKNFSDSTFALTLHVNKLRPFTLYECEVRSRTRIRVRSRKTNKSVFCFGNWSEPKTVEFKTRPAAPSVGPLAPPGTISKIGDSCKFVFFEIPKDKRNGIVNAYRGTLFPSNVEFRTNLLNPSFNCSETPKYIEIEGKTADGGWSPPRRVDFRPTTQTFVDLELWQEKELNRYKVLPRYSNGLKIKKAFLAVCNCSNTCHEQDFKCVGMRQVEPKASESGVLTTPLIFADQILWLNEEKVALYLEIEGSSGHVAYTMSDFTSCAYDKDPTRKSKFPSVKGVRDENGVVTFPIKREDLACSDTIRKPVYKIFTRVECNKRLVENKTTAKSSEKTLIVKVKVRSNEDCVVKMSLDGSSYQEQFWSKRTSIGTLWIGLVFVVLAVVVVFAIIFVNKETIKVKFRTLCEEHPVMTADMADHNLMNRPDTGSYVRREDIGYESIEHADTALITGRGSSEGSAFTEQGVNGTENTEHTDLLTTERTFSCRDGYVEREQV